MRMLNLIIVFSLAAVGCSPKNDPAKSTNKQRADKLASGDIIDLQGAGATFPYPLYSKWIADFQKIDQRVHINYQSIGSGGGIRQVAARTVDFGASDIPMTDEELAKTKGQLLHFPMTAGAVVVTYNLPGAAELRLTGEVLSEIFLGEVKTWNDSRLLALNPGKNLPSTPITIVYRSDGSGTTAIFTQYLALLSAKWKEKVGEGKSVKFPTGFGAKGNEGVAGQIKMSPGSVGYVELAYAQQASLPIAAIKNRAGTFMQPTIESISAAAASAEKSMSADLRVSFVDATANLAYPIAAFTYILAYEEQTDLVKGNALARFLWWSVHEGQAAGVALGYAPLPAPVVARVEQALLRLQVKGESLLGKK